MRARLYRWHSDEQSLLARSGTGMLVCHCNEAAMKLRLIEQACGCSMVRDCGGRKVRARLCLVKTQVECAGRQDQAPA